MRRLFGLVFWAAAAAAAIAAFTGDARTVSLRVWLVAFICWFAGALLYRVADSGQLAPSRLRLLALRSDKTDASDRGALKDFRSLESLVLRSRENARTHRQQLRPRLVVLADHYLLVHHGVHRVEQPELAAAVLGDAAWLIEDDTSIADQTARAPTLDDLDRFLDRILPSAGRTTSPPTTNQPIKNLDNTGRSTS